MTLYQPFLDHAIAYLHDRLPDLQPYPIPIGFESKSAIVGKGKHENEVVTTSYGYQSSKLRQIRAAHVQGGSSLQVLNFVIFPKLNYDLPFFGADLVTLPGGHLIALDMQPLFMKLINPICLGVVIFQKKQVSSSPLLFSGRDHNKMKWWKPMSFRLLKII
jgi:phycoerythrobilin:ferredoxin oxidoreductase